MTIQIKLIDGIRKCVRIDNENENKIIDECMHNGIGIPCPCSILSGNYNLPNLYNLPFPEFKKEPKKKNIKKLDCNYQFEW